MPRMKPMDAVVKVLEDEGVTVAFGVPGAAILPLSTRCAGRASATSACATRRAARTPPTATRGSPASRGSRSARRPGRHEHDHGPLHGARRLDPDDLHHRPGDTDVLHREAFQAVDIVEIARPVCKWAYQVKETAQLPWAFREAFRICREGRPGPVLIDLPLNVQKGPDIEWDAGTDTRLDYAGRPRSRPRSSARWSCSREPRADHRRRRRRDRGQRR